jgi:hypothetical protein
MRKVELRSDLDSYVIPRNVIPWQADKLQSSLKGDYAVAVKADPQDPEAMEYANQIFNAIRKTTWTAELSTADGDPRPGNGLCISVIGEKPQTQSSKPTPAQLLQEAFRSADIIVNCGSGQTAGDYKLYVVVGRRPLVVGQRLPLLFRIGSWIAHWTLPGAPI